jgi:hypothetical protein
VDRRAIVVTCTYETEAALNVWDRLKAGPPVMLYAYVSIMALLAITALWLIWRLVVRRKISPKRKTSGGPLSKADIENRLREAEAAGVDVSEAQAELKQLVARKNAVHLCFFGEVSAGKSSLIKALVPEADVVVDVVGGSTGGGNSPHRCPGHRRHGSGADERRH